MAYKKWEKKMNVDELEKSNYLIYSYIAGSHSYGLAHEDSDVDVRGVYVLPLKERLSIMDFDQEISNDSQDIKYFDIRKFMKLAADCNPALIEALFIPEDCIKICTPQMKKIIENRNLFISQKAYHTFSGYSFAQISKAKGKHKMVHNPKPETPPKKEDFCWIIPDSTDLRLNPYFDDHNSYMPFRPVLLSDYSRIVKDTNMIDLSKFHAAALEHVSNTFRLYYYGESSKGIFRGNDMLVCESIPLEDEWDKFFGIMIYNQHEYERALKEWNQYWDWVKNRNDKRWIDQQNKRVDYDVKNMSHCFRLLYSGKNILTFGEPIVRFEGEKREFLMDIRRNKFTYDYLMAKVEEEMKELDELKEKTTLPHGANIQKINELYQEIVNKSSFLTKATKWARRTLNFYMDPMLRKLTNFTKKS